MTLAQVRTARFGGYVIDFVPLICYFVGPVLSITGKSLLLSFLKL